MSNAIIMRPLVPTGYATVRGTAAGALVNVGNDYAGLTWSGTVSAGNADIRVDMGADVTIDTIALFGIAGITGGSPLIQIYVNTAAQGPGAGGGWAANISPFAGANALPNGKQAALWLAPTVGGPPASRYWTFTGLDVGAAFTIGRIALGRRIALARNFAFGGAFGVRDFGRLDFSNRAVMIRRRGPKLRTVGLTFPHVYKDEAEATVAPLIEMAGIDTPLLLVTDPDANAMRTRRMYFGQLSGDLGLVQRTAAGWQWQANMTSLF
jgi:hypothetical protein